MGSQGVEPDDSDSEWDDHINWYYGAQAVERARPARPGGMDPGMDLQEMLIQTLDRADRIHAETLNNAAPEVPVSPPRSPPTNSDSAPVEGRPRASQSPDRGPHVEPDGVPASQDHDVNVPMEAEYHVDANSPDRPPLPDSDPDSSDEEDVTWGESDDEADDGLQALEEAAATPLFAESEHSSMGATYLLMSSARLHKCTDTYLDELFRTLSMTILPTPNSLPKSYSEASKYLKRLGHSYQSIDACPNSCVLF